MIPMLDTLQLLDISDDVYFSESYANYISNSRLKLINPEQGGSPQLYKKGLAGGIMTESLFRGSVVHCITLQPDDYVIAPLTTRPTAKLGLLADECFKQFKTKWDVTDDEIIAASNKVDYYKNMMTQDRIKAIRESCKPYWEGRTDWESRSQDKREPLFLDSKSWEIVQACLKSLQEHKGIQNLLHPKGITQEPIVCNEGTLIMDVRAIVDGRETILKLKAKLDNFSINLETNTIFLNDLKTSGHILAEFGTNSFVNFHYSRQAAMYLWLLYLYANKTYGLVNPNMYVNFMVVSTIPDYRAGIYECSNSEIEQGMFEFKRLLRMVASCEIYGYDGSVGTNIDGATISL